MCKVSSVSAQTREGIFQERPMKLKFIAAKVMQLCLASVLVLTSGLTPALADDTEVFFPPQQTSLQTTNPNILFVIDTSGSMSQTDGVTDANGVGVTRLQRVQTAFNQIISTMGSNVNVGLMRYSALLGGPISFPVAPIDAYVDTIDTTGSGDRTVQQFIVDRNSEAYQATAGGAVSVAPATITLNGSNSNVGLRFDSIQVPQGVVVTSAQITFYATTGISTSSMPVTIQAEQAATAANYTAAANNITGRTYTGTPTPPAVSWSLPAASYINGDDFNTPDLKGLINSIVGRSDWCGGNALSLKFSTTSTTRTLAVHGSSDTSTDPNADNQGSALAPLLTLSFSPTDPKLTTGCNKAKLGSQIGSSTNDDSTETAESGNPNQPACKALFLKATPSVFPSLTSSGCGSKNKATKVGLRFPKINIPQGATILSAVIDFTPFAVDVNTPTLAIQAENVLTSASFSSTGANTVGTRIASTTVGTATWATTAWSSAAPSVYSTPDLTSLVQSLVNNGSWDPTNNALTFFITGSGGSGQHAAYASDGSLGFAPRLRIQIQGPAGRLTVRKYLEEIVNGYVAKGGTPTMGVLYEAARYFRGEAAFYGRTRSFGETYVAGTSVRYPGSSGSNIQLDGSPDYSQTSRISHRASFDYSKGTPTHNFPTNCGLFNLTSASCDGETWTGTAVYKSPITDGCQSNNIILLSDGLPNVTTSASPTTSTSPAASSAATLIKTMTGKASCVIPKDSTGTTQTEWQCGTELTNFLFTNDQSSVFGGPQNIRTYTIAFSPSVAAGGSDAAGAEFLKNLANSGGGQAFAANSISEVVSAFQSIIGNILNINTTFVAPAVTVNTFNRLTNRNELYFAVFRPDTDAVWNGNLKKYRIFQSASDASPQVYDSSNTPLPAVDSSTGYFKDGTKSFWSATADGSDIAKGGAASNLTNTRTVYTYVGAAAPSNVDLTQPANILTNSNTAVTAAMLGLPATATAADRTSLIQWSTGIDVLDENGNGSKTDARVTMGDPLHSEPALISYGGTDASPDIGIFMGTNIDGLHAFNSATGAEYFAFMPKELLANSNIFYTDSATYLTRPYGMDGPITSWINDGGDGVISGSDFAYIYAGLRRGGNSYYALDVTNRAAPKLKFQITGGSGSFAELGQTWSRAVHARIRIGGANKDVIIFSGGYDPAEDGGSATAVTADSQGRGVFVADAATGALLWWAGFDNGTNHPDLALANMNYSIPASPKAIDLNSDGLIDRIYLADTGGQVFRIVLGNDSSGVSSLSNATGSRIAALSGATVASAHRLFSTPDVALITQGVNKPFISISIGSGFHEHPLLQTNEDRFYVLRDPEISNTGVCTYPAPSTPVCTPLFINGDADLYDATANLAGSSNSTTAAQARVDIFNKKGLYIKLVNSSGGLTGEKVMSESVTFNGTVLFTTFQPGVTSGTCSAVQGLSRAYEINVTDGTPSQPLSGTTSTTLTAADRSKSLKQAGLPPSTTILFPNISSQVDPSTGQHCIGGGCTSDSAMCCVGAECFQCGLGLPVQKTSWRRIER
jgi:type IV pilus assembly protein PilY1